ncbi:MAG: radical SAM protein, partial [Bdellovibrionales bacterium]
MIDRSSDLQRDPVLEKLLKNKIPDASEIQLILFQHCNLACNFCGQDHKSKTGLDTIVQKAEQIVDFMKNNLRKKHFVNVMGGEIFNDDITDHIYEDYFRLLNHVHFEASQMDHEVRFSFATNLVFKKTDRVLSFFKKLEDHDIDFCLATSYDFTGRHNQLWDRQQYLDNTNTFSAFIRTINVVLTKPSIQNMINSKDPLFDQLYEKYQIFFEYYQPEKNPHILMPTDQEILDALIYLAKNYPKSSPVSEMINNSQNQMTCFGLNSMTLLPTGEKTRCRYLEYKPNSFNSEV